MMPNKLSNLTPKQLKIFNALQRYFTEHQESPTLKELAVLISTKSIRSVTQYLEALEKKGLITRSRYSNRGIKLIAGQSVRSEIISLPVIGNAGCDNLSIYADQQADEFVSLDREFLQGHDPKQTIVIRAIGRSMIDAGINSGDLVLTEVTKDVQDGEKVVAIIDDMAVIKKISFTENAVILSPMSPDPQYRPIVMREDFQVSGRVIDIIRNSKNQPEYVYDYDIKK
jgi:repressor LexA